MTIISIGILVLLNIIIVILERWRAEWRNLEAKRQVEWESFHIKGNEEP